MTTGVIQHLCAFSDNAVTSTAVTPTNSAYIMAATPAITNFATATSLLNASTYGLNATA